MIPCVLIQPKFTFFFHFTHNNGNRCLSIWYIDSLLYKTVFDESREKKKLCPGWGSNSRPSDISTMCLWDWRAATEAGEKRIALYGHHNLNNNKSSWYLSLDKKFFKSFSLQRVPKMEEIEHLLHCRYTNFSDDPCICSLKHQNETTLCDSQWQKKLDRHIRGKINRALEEAFYFWDLMWKWWSCQSLTLIPNN